MKTKQKPIIGLLCGMFVVFFGCDTGDGDHSLGDTDPWMRSSASAGPIAPVIEEGDSAADSHDRGTDLAPNDTVVVPGDRDSLSDPDPDSSTGSDTDWSATTDVVADSESGWMPETDEPVDVDTGIDADTGAPVDTGTQADTEAPVDTGADEDTQGADTGGGMDRSHVPPPPKGYHWEVVAELTDEFNGNALDRSKWDDYHPHWSGRAPSQFKKGNCFVEGGMLKLRSTLKRDPSTVNNPFKDIWVNAAACVSKKKSARVGYYYEARIKASSLSMTSSFWFRVGSYSEIDVIEHIGNPSKQSRQKDLPYQYHANTHFYGTKAGLKSKAAQWRMPTRGRDEFHVYGFWWKDPKTLWFYHNGQKVMEIIPSGAMEENLKMIFDTEVFPFATAGVANIGLPLPKNLKDNSKNTMLVDWVHTYRLVKDK